MTRDEMITGVLRKLVTANTPDGAAQQQAKKNLQKKTDEELVDLCRLFEVEEIKTLTEKKEPTQVERVHELLTAKDKWRDKVKLAVRADTLYWFVFLVSAGIRERKRVMKEENKGRLDAADVASLCSWEMDLERLVDQIQTVLTGEKVKPKE